MAVREVMSMSVAMEHVSKLPVHYGSSVQRGKFNVRVVNVLRTQVFALIQLQAVHSINQFIAHTKAALSIPLFVKMEILQRLNFKITASINTLEQLRYLALLKRTARLCPVNVQHRLLIRATIFCSPTR